METSKTAQLPDPRSIGRRPVAMLGIAAVALIAVCSSFAWRGTTVAAQAGGELQGLGIVTGTVTALKPFTAGHVYLRSQDPRRDMLYMVYTQRGAFKAVAVMPGNYELVAKARGLESDPQRIVVKSGANPAVKVTMRDAKDPDQYPTSVDPSVARSANGVLSPEPEIMYASYEEIYPPGPGLAVLEELCMHCHGENRFPLQPKSASAWQFSLDRMMGTALTDNDKRGLGEGILAGSASHFRFGIQDRKDVLEYLTKHFGPDKKPRAVRTDSEMPLDEAQLGKAQYIEYYIKADENDSADPPPAGAVASDSEQTATGVAGVRIMMMPTIDQQGNRWSVDRGVPSRLVKLDPRSGEYRAWTLPDTRAGVHDLVMDRQGRVWVLEFSRTDDGRVEGGGGGSSELDSRLLMFDPKTEKWEKIIDPDPDDVIRAKRKGPLMGGVVDSKGNVYVHWMLTGALSKYDVATGKASTYRIPTPNAVPYGAFIDPFDNVWLAEWGRGKLARFDTTTEAWTEFIPPNFPVNFRRGGQSDAEGNVWVGIWAAGKRPGMVAKLDPRTGRWTFWDIPHRGAQPYEVSVDKDGNIWFPDKNERRPDHPMENVRLNPRDGTFTFYPRPQFMADSTRVVHAEDGSVHYTARYGSAKDSSAFGVLYPDKDKITTLAPRMLNGPPGYAFKVPASARSSR